MAKSKTVIWLFVLAGTLWMFAGIRDVFAPGFFSFSGRVVTSSEITTNFALGIFFLLMATSMALKSRQTKG